MGENPPSALGKGCHPPRGPRQPRFTDTVPAAGAVSPEGGGSVTRVPGRRGSSRRAAAAPPPPPGCPAASPSAPSAARGLHPRHRGASASRGGARPAHLSHGHLSRSGSRLAPSQRAADPLRTRGPQSRRPQSMLGAVVPPERERLDHSVFQASFWRCPRHPVHSVSRSGLVWGSQDGVGAQSWRPAFSFRLTESPDQLNLVFHQSGPRGRTNWLRL